MLSFHRLGWEDKDTVRRYVGESPLSYFQFSNMYMWRRVMNYRICEEDGILYVTERYRDHPTGAFLPFGAEGREEMAIARLRESLDGPLRLRPLSEEQARQVASLFPEGRMIEKRGQWDYLYRASDLSTLPGRHYRRSLRACLRKPITELTICFLCSEKIKNLGADNRQKVCYTIVYFYLHP